MSKKFSAVSLFSGAGGMDVGFSQAGFDVIFANDIDQAACNTFNLNHTVQSHCGDLRDFTDTLLQYRGVDLIFGGPPCQGFSVAGKMDPHDERSKLIWDFMANVERLKPAAFVCENVKALAVNNRWQPVRDELIEKSKSMGYETALLILNSSDFGVPQARERMFLVGFKTSDELTDSNSLQEALYSALNEKKASPITIAELIRELGPAGSVNNRRVCSAIITYAKKPVLRKSPYAGMLFNGAGRPINPNGIALTLPASMGGNKTPIVDEDEIFKGKDSYVELYHQQLQQGEAPLSGRAPSRLRRITLDEAMAIQTFPSTYEFAGSQSAIFRQIGNAVPCHLAEVVAESVKELLDTGLETFTANYKKHRSS